MRKNVIVHGLQWRNEKGNTIPARTTGAACECAERCFEKVGKELLFHILTSFNRMPDKTKQDQYLSGLVIAHDPTWVGTQGKGGNFSEINKGKKMTTFKYYIPTGKFFGIFALITEDKCRLTAISLPTQGHVMGLW